jgi:hypothetical protein
MLLFAATEIHVPNLFAKFILPMVQLAILKTGRLAGQFPTSNFRNPPVRLAPKRLIRSIRSHQSGLAFAVC